jgi:hypothetical protein
MSFRTSVTIVASPRPRVGKTLLARVLTDFHRHEGRAVAAYDLNGGDGLLREFLPKQAQVAAIADVKGQMALFDTLVKPDDITRVVDLGHDTFESFFALAEHIGFTEEALARGIAPAVLFLLTPDRTAIEAFRSVRRRMPGAALIPVHNEIFGPTQYGDRYPLSMGDKVVRLPALAAGLRKFVEVTPFSFADVARAKEMPPEALDELERWLRKIYREFREIDLRLLLADLRSSITFGA